MVPIEPTIVGVVVGLLMAYAFFWEYRKYKALDIRIKALEARIEALIKAVGQHNGKADEPVKETVNSE